MTGYITPMRRDEVFKGILRERDILENPVDNARIIPR